MDTLWYLIYAALCVLAWPMDLFVTRLGFYRAYPLESYFLVFSGLAMLGLEMAREPSFRVLVFLLMAGLAGGSFLYESVVHARLRGLPPLPLAPGDPFPEPSLVAGGPTLIIYQRGTRCPFAASQSAMLEGQREALAETGIERVVVLLPEPAAAVERHAGIYPQLELASDPDRRIARTLGLVPRGRPEEVAPAAFLVDGDGQLRWQQRSNSYRTPPHPVWIKMIAQRAFEAARQADEEA